MVRARNQVQNFEGAMELFGGAHMVAGDREVPKARALAGGSEGPPPENFEKTALSAHLSAFQSLNLKYHKQGTSTENS